MKPADGLNTLRFVSADGWRVAPAGVIVPGRSVGPLAERLAKRARHYPSLRVTALRDRLIFWSVADEVSLPWIEEEPVYLTHIEKAVFLPIGQRPAFPAKWTDPIIDRLARQKEVSRPVLLLPSDGPPRAVGLGRNSRPVPAVDWKGMANHDG